MEIIFLFFFIPFSLYFFSLFGQGFQAQSALVQNQFALKPPSLDYQPNPNAVLTNQFSSEYFSDQEGVWQFINNVFFNQVFREGYCQGNTVGRVSTTPYSKQFSQPIVLGVIRIRQVRVKAVTCPVNFPANMSCYPVFSVDNMDTANFQTFNFTQNTGEMNFPGKLGTYPGSGYIVDIVPPGCNNSLQMVKNQLLNARSTHFIDNATRALILTLSTLDPNTGVVATTRLCIEFSYSNSVYLSTSKVNSALYFRTLDATMGVQVLFVFMFVSQTLCVLLHCRQMGCFRGVQDRERLLVFNGWILVDLLRFALVIYLSVLVVPLIFWNANLILGFSLSRDFFSGSNLSLWGQTTNELSGAIVWFSLMKILFHCTEYFDSMTLLFGTGRRLMWDFFLFILFIMVFSVGFMFCGLLVFGGSLQWYADYGKSAYSVMCMLMLIADYLGMVLSEPFGFVSAPIFTFLYLFVFTWYIFAVLVGIVFHHYSREKSRLEKMDMDKRRWIRQASKLGARKSLLRPARVRWWEDFTILNDEQRDRILYTTHDQFLSFAQLVHVLSRSSLPNIAPEIKEEDDDDDDNEKPPPLYHAQVLQAMTFFQQLYLIPANVEESEEVLLKFAVLDKVDKPDANPATLLRLKTHIERLGEENTRARQNVLDRLQSARLIQDNLHRTLDSLRKQFETGARE